MTIFKSIFAALTMSFALSAVPAHASAISGPFTFQSFVGPFTGIVGSSANLSGASLALNEILPDQFFPPATIFLTSFSLLPTSGATEYSITETITNNFTSPVRDLDISLLPFTCGVTLSCPSNPKPLVFDFTSPPTSSVGGSLAEAPSGTELTFNLSIFQPGVTVYLFPPGGSATFSFDLITCDGCSGISGAWQITQSISYDLSPEAGTGALGLAGLGLLIVARRKLVGFR